MNNISTYLSKERILLIRVYEPFNFLFYRVEKKLKLMKKMKINDDDDDAVKKR